MDPDDPHTCVATCMLCAAPEVDTPMTYQRQLTLSMPKIPSGTGQVGLTATAYLFGALRTQHFHSISSWPCCDACVCRTTCT
jgi:hypothetical protein